MLRRRNRRPALRFADINTEAGHSGQRQAGDGSAEEPMRATAAGLVAAVLFDVSGAAWGQSDAASSLPPSRFNMRQN